VRGDSLRDLYAKTLALVGLGVLAGVGALFDYWPAGIRLVPAAPALELPELAASFSPTTIELATPVALPRRVSSGGRSMPEPAVPTVEETAFTSVAASDSVATLPSFEVREVPESLGVVAAEAPLHTESEAIAMTAALTAGDAVDYAPGAGWREPVALVDSSSGADESGFLSDALRKTRTSLVRTGARTGASIIDAVRVVGGAVRRALPN
jgi:hypothetical protein